MCYSRAEGGQRCFAHAKAKYDKAAAAIAATPEADQNWDDFIRAKIEYCSTPQGEADVRAEIEAHKAAGSDPQVIEAMEGTIQRGLEMREKNLAIRNAVRDAAKPVVGEPKPESQIQADMRAAFDGMRGGWEFDEQAPKVPGVVVEPDPGDVDPAGQWAAQEWAKIGAMTDIAQSVRAANPDLVGQDARGKRFTVTPDVAEAARENARGIRERWGSRATKRRKDDGPDVNAVANAVKSHWLDDRDERGVIQPGTAEMGMEDAYRQVTYRIHPPKTDESRGDREDRFITMAARGETPTDPAEVPAFAAFNTAVSRKLSREEMMTVVVRRRAEKVLNGHANSGNPNGYHPNLSGGWAVRACNDIKYGKVPATPENVRDAALRVTSLLSESTSLDRDAQVEWSQDMVRDLSGQNVTIKRVPGLHDMPQLDSKYRWRVIIND